MNVPVVSVVIPYFQTTADPLRKALSSVFKQRDVAKLYVIIVDDGSPLPAKQIVEQYFAEEADYIRIIHQLNEGAAKARNTGLDHLAPSTTYVAFLDSDDEWHPDHLFNAIQLFEMGYDFYFANHQRSDWDTDKFTRIGFIVEQHIKIDRDYDLYQYVGDTLLAILRDHMISTSTVVYRRNLLDQIRFPSDLILGEDEVFWVKATRRAKVGFCYKVEAFMGKGVNISQAVDDGQSSNQKSFQLMTQNIYYWKRIFAYLPDETQLKDLRQLRIRQLRDNFAASVLHRIRRRQSIPIRSVIKFTSVDPSWIVSLGTIVFRRLFSQNKNA